MHGCPGKYIKILEITLSWVSVYRDWCLSPVHFGELTTYSSLLTIRIVSKPQVSAIKIRFPAVGEYITIYFP